MCNFILNGKNLLVHLLVKFWMIQNMVKRELKQNISLFLFIWIIRSTMLLRWYLISKCRKYISTGITLRMYMCFKLIKKKKKKIRDIYIYQQIKISRLSNIVVYKSRNFINAAIVVSHVYVSCRTKENFRPLLLLFLFGSDKTFTGQESNAISFECLLNPDFRQQGRSKKIILLILLTTSGSCD